MSNSCETMNSSTGAGFCKENYREQKTLNNSTIYSNCSEPQWDEEKSDSANANSPSAKGIKGNFE